MNLPLPPLIFFNKTKSRGFNLIEVAIVLGIAGLVIGGIWIAAAAVAENNRQKIFVSNILKIVGAVQTTVKRWPIDTSVGLDFRDMAGPGMMPKSGWKGIIPEDMITSDFRPMSPWGEPVIVGVNYAGGPPIISISWNGTDKSRCISVGGKMLSATKGMAFSSLHPAQDPADPGTITVGPGIVANSMAEIEAGCAGTKVMRFIFDF